MADTVGRITGIGGVFFKTRGDAKVLAAWYRDVLGLELEDFGGAVLKWPAGAGSDGGLTVWHLVDADSTWFAPSPAPFMINYRVDDLDAILARVNAAGVTIVKAAESHENGRFAWILDPDGNKLELWEPKPLTPKA